MRILYSHRTKSADGQLVHISAITNALQKLGHDVMISGPEGFGLAKAIKPKRMNGETNKKPLMKNITFGIFYELAELLYSVPAYIQLAKAASTHQPDFIYERYNLFFLSGVWLKKKLGIPLLLEVNAPLRKERREHGNLTLDAIARWAEQKVWRSADLILPVSDVLADEIRAAGIEEDRIHIIHNGIDPEGLVCGPEEKIRTKYNLHGKTVIGFTGFIREWHGLDLVLDFLATKRSSDCHALIVGDGPHLEALKIRAQKEGLSDRVTFTGTVQRKEIGNHISAFDIALQPRVTDYASPLKLFEYMAMGKAILAPAQPNIEEVLTDRDNAVLFTPEDRESFFEKLDTIIKDKALAEKIGQSARQTIFQKKYTWQGNAERILSLYSTRYP